MVKDLKGKRFVNAFTARRSQRIAFKNFQLKFANSRKGFGRENGVSLKNAFEGGN